MTLGLQARSGADRGACRCRHASGTARVVERLGDRTLVHVALAGWHPAHGRGSRRFRRSSPASQWALRVDGSAAHLFAADGTGYHGEAH